MAYVHQPRLLAADQKALDEKLAMARAAGASIEILDGEDPVDVLLDFAKARGITQLFIGHTQRSGLRSRIWGNPVEKLIRRSHGMDVRVFPNNRWPINRAENSRFTWATPQVSAKPIRCSKRPRR